MARWFLLRAGLPVGVSIAVWPVLVGPLPTITDFVLVAFGTGLVLAGGLWAVASVFQRLGWRSRRSAVVLGLLLACGTVAGGLTALWWTVHSPNGRWTKLPDPPEPPQRFVGPTCATIGGNVTTLLVVTSGGRYLGYGPDAASRYAWTERSSPPESARGGQSHCLAGAPEGRPPPRLPGDVVAVHRVVEAGGDCGGTTYYILRRGGSIWTWSDYSCAPIPGMLVLAYGGIFAILGSATGVSFVRARHERCGKGGSCEAAET